MLVIGSGAREHALCLALAADPSVTSLVCAPGNAGTSAVAEQRGVDATDPAAVAALAQDVTADLVVIGPEAPLVAGVADAVRAAGIACFGPSAEAARLEGSKAFAKDVMAAAGVPTARARVCTTADEAVVALDEFGAPYVVKDIGLAMTARGPRVVEFNARFGDPETQVVLALLETPLGALLHAAATGGLATHPPLRWGAGSAVTVVIAAAGYPGPPRTGDVITGA